ncbi:hypothetical protein N7467_002928 [Penicillium canescens]|nr:hypothetical protein N7467_002928 [Penicillium canescens]
MPTLIKRRLYYHHHHYRPRPHPHHHHHRPHPTNILTTTTTSPVPTEAITPVLFVGTPAGWRLPAKSRGDGLTGLAGALKELAEKWGKGKEGE